MDKASEALADVRGWLCDNLSEGDAGKVCGMLSVVSRHIAELEEENAKMRKLFQKAWKWEKNGCYECPLEKDCKVLWVYDGDCGMAVETERELQELGIEAPHDN